MIRPWLRSTKPLAPGPLQHGGSHLFGEEKARPLVVHHYDVRAEDLRQRLVRVASVGQREDGVRVRVDNAVLWQKAVEQRLYGWTRRARNP